MIAAGSLLDFELEKIGMPVGRVSSLYMYPLSFLEFLAAKNEALLVEMIAEHEEATPVSEPVHQKFLRLVGEYFAVGGMPEAVACWRESGDMRKCVAIHRAIVDTYRQDFNKYAQESQSKYVELLFNLVPARLSKKFKYSEVPGEFRKRDLQPALELVDYLIQRHHQIVPVEVKSGAPGTLKSLRLFLDERKRLCHGVRLSALNYAAADRLFSRPLYAIARLMDFTKEEAGILV